MKQTAEMPLKENQSIVKSLAKEFRGKTNILNCFDANICKSQPQRGCVRPRSLAVTPLALSDFFRVTLGSLSLATQGFEPESLWDSLKAATRALRSNANHFRPSFVIRHSSFCHA